MIKISKVAKQKILEILKESPGKVFRIELQGSGCAGFQYVFSLSISTEDDIVIDKIENHEVIIDPISAMYLDESVLDYETELFSQAFVINNPNVTGTCGCGSSMSF